MRKVENREFADKSRVKRFEGGVVYAADADGKFYLVLDEGTMSDFLDEEDCEGIEFVKTYEFDTAAERNTYIAKRNWN
ncbi:MAG: hypothetical protein ACNYPI_00015 [Arenicellales bacterium WSBS_2016_MAG_OTU3]